MRVNVHKLILEIVLVNFRVNSIQFCLHFKGCAFLGITGFAASLCLTEMFRFVLRDPPE